MLGFACTAKHIHALRSSGGCARLHRIERAAPLCNACNTGWLFDYYEIVKTI